MKIRSDHTQKKHRSREPLFFNEHILIEKETEFYENWLKNDIVFVNDVLKADGSIMEFNDFNTKNGIEIQSAEFENMKTAIQKWVQKEKIKLLKEEMSHMECFEKCIWQPIFDSAIWCNHIPADLSGVSLT